MQRRITIDESKVGSELKIQIIENNSCGGILPYSCYYDGVSLVGSYDCEGFVKLRDIGKVSGQAVLTILESVIRALEELREYLFFPEDCVISPDTVFIKDDYSRACLIIVSNDRPLREKRYFGILIRYLKTKTTLLGSESLERVSKFMDSNPNYQRLIAFIEGQKTDLSFFETK